jgi:hypothetical protein
MPGPEEILATLERTANEWMLIAIAWHIVIVAALLAAIAGWRPGRRTAGVLLTLPLLSVSALSWIEGNPFNGTALLAVAGALMIIAAQWPGGEAVAGGSAWSAAAGAIVLAFGLIYPHFLAQQSPMVYLYAAPTGLVPCPTLAAVVGITLLAGGLGSAAWGFMLGAASMSYGLFGVLRLGVLIDAGLVAGAAALLAQAMSTARRRTRGAHRRDSITLTASSARSRTTVLDGGGPGSTGSMAERGSSSRSSS